MAMTSQATTVTVTHLVYETPHEHREAHRAP